MSDHRPETSRSNRLNPQEFAFTHSTRLSRLMRDANQMTAAAFRARYGVKVRDARDLLTRFREISTSPDHVQEAARIASELALALERGQR